MAQRVCTSLDDLGRHQGCIKAKCRRCGRVAVFSPGPLCDHFRKRGWSRQWSDVPQRLRCDPRSGGCGARNPRISFVQNVALSSFHGLSVPLRAPSGIDAFDWMMADERGRKDMLRRARG